MSVSEIFPGYLPAANKLMYSQDTDLIKNLTESKVHRCENTEEIKQYADNTLVSLKMPPETADDGKHKILPFRGFDFITALYVPRDCENIKLYVFDSIVSEYHWRSNGEEIVIEGQVYKRVVLLQPAIPVSAMYYTEVYFVLSDSRNIYMEGMCLRSDLKHVIKNRFWTCLGTNALLYVVEGSTMRKMMENGRIQ